MNVLIIWLSTILGSRLIDFVFNLKLYNELAKNDYTINIGKLEKCNEEDATIFDKIIKYIPFINIILSLGNLINSDNLIDEMYFHLKSNDCLEKMSIKDQKTYCEKPTGLTAYNIALKNDNLMRKAKRLIVPGNNGQSESIVYYILEKNFQIKIVKVIGPLIFLKEEEQKNIVENYIFESFDSIYAKLFGTFDDNDVEYDENNLTRRQRIIKELKELKRAVLNSKREEESKEKNKVYKK